MQRIRIFNQGIVKAPAADCWEWLTDWAGTRRASKTGGGSGNLEFSRIKLIGGDNDVPRTRVIDFPQLGEVRETVLFQDDKARHLYYNIENPGPMGIRNYLATNDIDDLGDCLSQVTITARMDLPDDADPVPVKNLIDNAHNQIVISGMRKYFAND